MARLQENEKETARKDADTDKRILECVRVCEEKVAAVEAFALQKQNEKDELVRLYELRVNQLRAEDAAKSQAVEKTIRDLMASSEVCTLYVHPLTCTNTCIHMHTYSYTVYTHKKMKNKKKRLKYEMRKARRNNI